MNHPKYSKPKSFKVFLKLLKNQILPSSIITTPPCKSNFGNKEMCLESSWDVKNLSYPTLNHSAFKFSKLKIMKINSLEIIDSSRPWQTSLVMLKSLSMTSRMGPTTHSLRLEIIFRTNLLICMTIKKSVRLISPSKPITMSMILPDLVFNKTFRGFHSILQHWPLLYKII